MSGHLHKNLSAVELILFGTGTIIGAGIYVLVGKIAGIAGYLTPVSFIVAAIIALFTALSYAQLASVYPKTASAVVYIDKAFSTKALSTIIGYLVLIILLTAAATIVKGFAGYMQVLINLPEYLIIGIILLLLGAIAIKGISESIWLIGTITLIEIGGLLFVIFVLRDSMSIENAEWLTQLKSVELGDFSTIMSGAFLAFFAFVGFEGIANIAEETKNPLKAIPAAILASLVISTALYLLITFVCLGSMSITELASTEAPMADLMREKGEGYAKFISIISMIAVINGVMSMVLMGARVLYGMAENHLLPKYLFHAHPKFKTPDRSTIVFIIVLFLLTILFSLLNLANIASFLILFVFGMVNLALVVLKVSKRLPVEKTLRLPIVFPVLGFFLCSLMIVQQLFEFF